MVGKRMALPIILNLLFCANPVISSQIELTVVNDSGHTVELLWINPTDLELVSQGPFSFGETGTFTSYVGHEFEIRELPNEHGVCNGGEETCRTAFLEINEDENPDVTFLINNEFKLERFSDDDDDGIYNKAAEVEYEYVIPNFEPIDDMPMSPDNTASLLACQEKARQGIQMNNLSADIATKTLDDLISCAETNATYELSDVSGKVYFQRETRTTIAERFENYTCADEDMPTSPALHSKTWSHKGFDRKVSVLHERERSKVHVIKNFITLEECAAVEEAGEADLHRAVVADDKGGSKLSPNRKAMQSGISVEWDKEEEGDHIAAVSRRVYDYANWVTGLGIEEHGQEDLMTIQYFGRGKNDTEPDRYMPHCDGDCTGLKHKAGTRVATMVMYCTIPNQGGATNFRNSGLRVKPEMGAATFFSYIGPDMYMDNGFTEHSGCPVIEGEKKIVTQWIRLGVDSENPWDSFNSLGIKIDTTAED